MSIRARSAWFSAAITVAVLGALIGANVIASKSNTVWDLTQAGNNTLSPQSIYAVRQLKSDMQVIGLFQPTAPGDQDATEALIALYQAQSQHVKYRRENVSTDVTDVKHYGVTLDNTIVLDYQGRTQLLEPGSQNEQDLTAAILRIELQHVPVVCWTDGVGGRSLTDRNDKVGYSALADLLSKNAFTTRDLPITQITAIPTDCDVVALVGATLALRDPVVKALDAYLAGGGRLFVASDAWDDPAVTNSVNSVLKPYGRAFTGALVIEADPSRYLSGDPTSSVVFGYGSSPIASSVTLPAVFPQTTATTYTATPGVRSTPVAGTSPDSYGVVTPRPAQDLARQKSDAAGPFTVMATLESVSASNKTRIVMVGTSGFAENAWLPPNSLAGNLQLTLGSFEWLAGEDSLVTFPPKPNRVLPLTLTQDQQSTLIFITAVVMPGIIVVAGIAVWWRRRVFA